MAKGKVKEVKKKTKVMVFGEEVGDREERNEEIKDLKRRFRPRHRHSSLTWGLFFILIGLLVLLSNFNALPPVVWNQVARLWPVLIVLIGFDILLGRSEVADFIKSLIGIFVFFTILGIIFHNVSPNLLSGLPDGIQNYLNEVSNYFLKK